jgi:hypothetical protein
MVTGTTTSSISLSWATSSGATGYEVYRDASDGGAFTFNVYDNTGTSMSDSGLTPDTTYYYKVLAKNSAGSSALSGSEIGTTQAASGVPATPTVPWVTGTTTTTISVAWAPASGATGYILQWDSSATGAFSWEVYVGPNTFFNDDGVFDPGTVHYYRVIATNASGNSAPSPVLMATTDTGVSGDIWEPDDDYLTSTPLAVDVEQVHSIDPVGEEDWYSIAVVTGNAYIISTYDSGGVSTDTVIYLYDNDAVSVIDSDDDGGGSGYSLLEFTATATTTYYVKIYEFGYNEAGDYAIILTEGVAPVTIDIDIQ